MLGKRVLFAAIGVLFIILLFYLGGWFLNLSVLIIAIIGMRELYNAFIFKDHHPNQMAGYTSFVLFLFFHWLFEGKYDLVFILAEVLLAVSLPVFVKTMMPIDSAVTMLGFFYPGLILVFAIALKEQTLAYKNYLLILTLFGNFSTDTFAYFAGKKFGKRKLCPSISPKKTIEGSIGGLAGSVLIVLLVGYIISNIYNIHIEMIHLLMLGLLTGIFSQLGDLSASVIKRYCGIKDFGHLMPGHGGILDRIDSLLFSIPVVYIYYIIILAA